MSDRGIWCFRCRVIQGLRRSYDCTGDTMTSCCAGGGAVGRVWKEDRTLGGTMCVGTRGNISDMRGNEGESGESVQGSAMLLWRRPRPRERGMAGWKQGHPSPSGV